MPTVFRIRGYRFFFYSREEERIHIHVEHGDNEAKFWIKPLISLCKYYGFNSNELNEIKAIIEEKEDVIIKAWNSRS